MIQKTIKKETFSGCSKLKQIIQPQLLQSIDHNAFAECSSLQQVFFPIFTWFNWSQLKSSVIINY